MKQSANLLFRCLAMIAMASCAQEPVKTPYEASTPNDRSHFKRVMMPFPPRTSFKISQGAFGANTHHDPGHEYTWDFDVPLGTPVLSVEDGTVLQVWEPDLGGGCDPKFNDGPHNIKIEHHDKTVAQYVHVKSLVHEGDFVRKGQPIAVTAINGFICTPQLDFGVYLDRHHLYGSGHMRSIPLVFDSLPGDGIAHEGYVGDVSPRLEIVLGNTSPREITTRGVLTSLFLRYDLVPYVFTRQVEIQEYETPRSSPMLRLNTRCGDNADCLLTQFLHEQIHWFLDYHDGATRAAIQALRDRFPNAPSSGSEGQEKTTESSYLHLIVGWLELQGDKRYLGSERARALAQTSDVYPWVYAQVLAHEDEIGAIIKQQGLAIP